MAGLSAGGGTSLMRCGCDVHSFRGVYMIPMQVSSPRRIVRVVAEVQRSGQGSGNGSGQGRAKKTKSNAVGSLNSALDDAGDRVSGGDAMRSEKEENREGVEEEKAPEVSFQQLLMERLKLDKALDEVVGFMAPREKGDIRDVILMSLSFAVLVYISQRLVCLYCVVRHMASQQF